MRLRATLVVAAALLIEQCQALLAERFQAVVRCAEVKPLHARRYCDLRLSEPCPPPSYDLRLKAKGEAVVARRTELASQLAAKIRIAKLRREGAEVVERRAALQQQQQQQLQQPRTSAVASPTSAEEERQARVRENAAVISGSVEAVVDALAAILNFAREERPKSAEAVNVTQKVEAEPQVEVTAAADEGVATEEEVVVTEEDAGAPDGDGLSNDGLSAEEMMELARERAGSAGSVELGREGEEALRAAFEALEAPAPATSGREDLRSDVVRGAAQLVYEARAFAEGAKAELQKVRELAADKAKLDATLVLRTADFVLRRVLLDTVSLIGSATSALALGPADEASAAAAEASPTAASPTPFAEREGSLERQRALRASGGTALAAAASEADGEAGAAAAKEAAAEAARQRERAEELRREAYSLLTDAGKAYGQRVESWLNKGELTASAGELPADWTERAGRLGGEVAGDLRVSTREALQATRRDFESYNRLAAAGALPTLAEEIGLEDLALAPTALPAFRGASDPAEQRRQRMERLQLDLATKQLKAAAAVAGRAGKDAGDAAVFGVLPAVRAAGKVAGRRVLPAVQGALPESVRPALGAEPAPLPAGGTAAVVRELAIELTAEYRQQAAEGVRQGYLPDIEAALKGRLAGGTSKLAEGLQQAQRALGGEAAPGLPGGAEAAQERAGEEATSLASWAGRVVPAGWGARRADGRAIAPFRAPSERDEGGDADDATAWSAAGGDDVQVASEVTAAMQAAVELAVEVVQAVEVEVYVDELPAAAEAARGPTELEFGVEAGVEVEAEAVDVAVDVAVVSSEVEESSEEQLLQAVDAAVYTAELAVRTLVGRLTDEFTPDERKSWVPLRAFREQVTEERLRSTAAAATLFDTLADSLDRK